MSPHPFPATMIPVATHDRLTLTEQSDRHASGRLLHGHGVADQPADDRLRAAAAKVLYGLDRLGYADDPVVAEFRAALADPAAR